VGQQSPGWVWLHTYLPHVLSKINRVHYGLLAPPAGGPAPPGDTSGLPPSRRLLAVPFVGKVPLPPT